MTELRKLIRQVGSEYPRAAPNEIARHVAKLTPPAEIDEYYEHALQSICADVLRQDRNTAMNHAMGTPTNFRTKADMIRSWWEELMESLVHTADGYKQFGECTVADVEFCIAEREAHITRVQRQIGHYRTIRQRMLDLGVTFVRDLPEPHAVTERELPQHDAEPPA